MKVFLRFLFSDLELNSARKNEGGTKTWPYKGPKFLLILMMGNWMGKTSCIWTSEEKEGYSVLL